MNHNVDAIHRKLHRIFVAQVVDDLILQIWMHFFGKTAYLMSYR